MRSWTLRVAPQTPPCAAGSYGQHRNPSNEDEPSRSKRPGDRGQCRGTTTEHRSSPWAPHQPKLACNSGTRTFCSARKRCNSNGAISTFEIRVGELHATFLRNHNMRHHKGPKQKTAQAQKTPTARGERRPQHSFPAAPTGGFTTIDAPPRRVAGVSQPYGRNSPHAPTHNRQLCARATTQHPAHPAPRPYTTSPPQHSQTPPRHHPRRRGVLLP